MPFCPSSLPGRSKINIISKLGYAQTTSFYKKPKYYLICYCFSSTIFSNNLLAQVVFPRRQRDENAGLWGSICPFFQQLWRQESTRLSREKWCIHASVYPTGILSWDDPLELSRGGQAFIFSLHPISFFIFGKALVLPSFLSFYL